MCQMRRKKAKTSICFAESCLRCLERYRRNKMLLCVLLLAYCWQSPPKEGAHAQAAWCPRRVGVPCLCWQVVLLSLHLGWPCVQGWTLILVSPFPWGTLRWSTDPCWQQDGSSVRGSSERPFACLWFCKVEFCSTLGPSLRYREPGVLWDG